MVSLAELNPYNTQREFRVVGSASNSCTWLVTAFNRLWIGTGIQIGSTAELIKGEHQYHGNSV